MEESYSNGGQYEDQPYQDDYQQQNESGDGGRRPFTRDDDDKKLFVGGLSVETTEDDLRDHFSNYGKVTNCILKTDNMTQRSRCFGFIVFENKEDLQKVLDCSKDEHIINGKSVDPKRANPRQASGPGGGGGGGGGDSRKKIFVGGVPGEVTEEQIHQAFSAYGKVETIDLPYDKKENGDKIRRGFVFLSFEDEKSVEDLVKMESIQLCGKSVDIKRATPKQDNPGGRGGFGGRGGRGGGRGGRGSYNNYGNDQWGGQGGQWGGQGGQWGGQGGYDYSQQGYGYNGGYPGYGGGYDYSAYYGGGGGGGWGQGWGQGYDPSQYGYPGGYGGYGGDYSGWSGYGGYQGGEGGGDQQQQQQQQQGSSAGTGSANGGYKARGGAAAAGKQGYHPYSR